MSDSIRVFWKNEKPREKEVLSGFSKRVVVGGEEEEYRSYESDNTSICVFKDGAISLSNYDGEGSVYLYPDQLEHLQKALKVAIKQAAQQPLAVDIAPLGN